MKETKDDPYSQLAVSLLCFSLFVLVVLPFQQRTLIRYSMQTDNPPLPAPKKTQCVTFVSFMYTGFVWACVSALGRVCTVAAPLDGSNTLNTKVYSQTHMWSCSCRKHNVYSMEMTAEGSQHMNYQAEQEDEEWQKGEGDVWWMWKWQEEIVRLIVLRSSLGDLGRVRSQGL